MNTAHAKTMSKKRKSIIEHVMGTMKVWLGKIPLLTKGFDNVTSEIKLFTASYNIKRLLSLISFENLKKMIGIYINPDISKNDYCFCENQNLLGFYYITFLSFLLINFFYEKI